MICVRRLGWLSEFLVGMICIAGVVIAGGTQRLVPPDPNVPVAFKSIAQASSEGPSALTVQLEGLFREWKAIPSTQMGEKVPAIKSGIDVILTNYLIRRLDERLRPLRIQDDLNKALTTATWESVFGLSPAAVTIAMKSNPPASLVFVMEGTGPASGLHVGAFAIGYGNTFFTCVHAFAPDAGEYHVVNSRCSQLDGRISGAVRARAFVPHELRVIVWCLHIGSPEALTSIALYRFDGNTLQTIWKRDNVPGARVTVAGSQVTIESNHITSVRRGIRAYQRNVFRQVPTGLKLIASRRWTEH